MKISTGIRTLTGICAIILFFFSSSCFFTERTAERLLKQSSFKSYDMLIVPGVPLENGKWSRMMKARICWSKYLYDNGIVKNIIYSGSSVYTPYYEGKVMALYAEALGIPSNHIFYETKAEHSTENIYYSYKKAKQLGFITIALASDRFQTKAYEKFTQEKVSSEIVILPMVVDTVKMMALHIEEPIIDCRKAFNKDFVSLKKRETYRERLRGTKGEHIDGSLYE